MARLWKISDSAAFKYLRNPQPAKVNVLQNDNAVATHPWQVEQQLLEYGGDIETWTQQDLENTWDRLVNTFCFLMPRMEFLNVITTKSLRCVCVGGTTCKQDHPRTRWMDERRISCPTGSGVGTLLEGVSGQARLLIFISSCCLQRVPIPKTTQGIPSAGMIRPIDVPFEMLGLRN